MDETAVTEADRAVEGWLARGCGEGVGPGFWVKRWAVTQRKAKGRERATASMIIHAIRKDRTENFSSYVTVQSGQDNATGRAPGLCFADVTAHLFTKTSRSNPLAPPARGLSLPAVRFRHRRSICLPFHA